MKIGIAADHGGFELKQIFIPFLQLASHIVVDFGAMEFNTADVYQGIIVPLANALSERKI